MYQSPINAWLGDLKLSVDDNIFRAVQNYDISVDKDELIKALQYDRNQYGQGYKDGYDDGYSQAKVDILENLKNYLEGMR